MKMTNKNDVVHDTLAARILELEAENNELKQRLAVSQNDLESRYNLEDL